MPTYVVSRYVRRRPGVMAWEVIDEYATREKAEAVREALGRERTRLDALHEDGWCEPLDANSRPRPLGSRGMPR